MTSKRLIINADDFGWARAITDAVVLAHEQGVVSSTTMLVNQAASEELDLRIMTDPAFLASIQSNHIELISYAGF